MATPEQKAAIKKRAEELIASGMQMGKAAQQAYSEIIKPVSNVEAARAEAELQSKVKSEDLASTRTSYVEQRAEALQKAGVDELAARSRAQAEFDKTYAGPVTGPYGDKSQSPFRAAPPKEMSQPEPDIFTALRPQTTLPQTAVVPERERIKQPAVQQMVGPGPDFDKLYNSFVEGGLPKSDASKQLKAFKNAYDINLLQEQNALISAGKPLPDDFSKKVWESTTKEIFDLPKALENKESYIKDPTKRGPQDAYALAFSKQIIAGEGVPNLTTAQGRYMTTLADAEIAEKKEALKKEYADKPLLKTETEVMDVRGGSAPKTVQRELKGQEKEDELDRMARQGIEKPFWTDPEEVKRRLQNPEKYTQPGVFTDTSAFGTQQESDVAWLLRGAMAPLNVTAAVLYPVVMTGFDKETRAAVDEMRRRERPKAYKDNPILYNIAEGRGFVGEAAEVSKLTGLDTEKILGPITIGDIYVAGNFAADLLDPTLDIAAGVSKGLKVGAEATKAAKALQLEGPVKFGITQGLKEGTKTAVAENAAVNMITRRLGVNPGDIRLALSNKAAEEISKVIDNAPTPNDPEILRTVREKTNAFDNFINSTEAGTGKRLLSQSEWREAFADAMVRNPDIMAKMRAAEAPLLQASERLVAAAPDAQKQMMKVKTAISRNVKLGPVFENLIKSDAEIQAAMKRSLIENEARKAVFKGTKDTVLSSGIIAMTRNTFATPDVAKKIMADVVNDDVIKISNDIRKDKANYMFKPKQTTVGSKLLVSEGFKLKDNQADVLRAKVSDLSNQKVISQNTATTLFSQIDADFISTQDLRKIIDATIDSAARKYSVVKGENIRQLSPFVSQELTKPLETRDFSPSGLKQWSVKKNLIKPPESMTPFQRGVYEEAVSKISKMDAKLRTDMSRILSDNKFRWAYQIPEGTKLTRKEAMGYLINGPEKQRGASKRILKLAVDKMFPSERYQQDLFDLFNGLKLDETTDIWTVKGRAELDKLINRADFKIQRDPALFESEMNNLVAEAKKMLDNPDYLDVPKSSLKIPLKDVSNELLISSYYQAEADRILSGTISKMVDESPGATSGQIFSQAATILGQKQFNSATAEFISQMNKDPRFINRPVAEQYDIISKARGLPSASNQDAMRKIMAEIWDFSEIVMRNNQIPQKTAPVDEIMKTLEGIKNVGGDTYKRLELYVGKDVAKQIQSALSSNDTDIQRGLKEIFAEAAMPLKSFDYAKTIPGKILDAIRNSFYTLLLSAAPRFHGGNIFGAPALVYSTTGRLISPLPIPGTTTFDSMRMLIDAGTVRGGRTVAKDAAGRAYTADEVYRALIERGGESIKRSDIPSIAAKDALLQLKQHGGVDRAVTKALELPNTEDLMFRGAIAIEALKEGRSLDDAMKLSKEALYDKGSILEQEKNVQRAIMFYAFQRNNLVNLLSNIVAGPKGIKRIVNSMKFKRGVETIGIPGTDKLSAEERKYLPTSAATRIVIAKAGDIGEKGSVIALPPDSTLAAVELLSNILALNPEIVMSAIRPEQKLLLGTEDEKLPEIIPPEHVAIYNSLNEIANIGGGSVDIMSALAGEKIVPMRSDAPGNVDGYVYPLLSEGARKNYARTLTALQIIGLSRLMSDVPNSLRAPGTKVAQAFESTPTGIAQTTGYALGLLTPMKTLTAEQQRLRALMSQDAEGRKMLKDIDDVLLEDKISPLKKSDLTGQAAEIKAAKAEGTEEKLGLTSEEKEYIRLAGRINSLESKMESGPLSDELINAYVAEIEKNVARMEELEKVIDMAKVEKALGE